MLLFIIAGLTTGSVYALAGVGLVVQAAEVQGAVDSCLDDIGAVLGADRDIAQLHHLVHGRQLVSDVDRPQPQRLPDLLHDLQVGSDTRARVQMELDHCGIVTPAGHEL